MNDDTRKLSTRDIAIADEHRTREAAERDRIDRPRDDAPGRDPIEETRAALFGEQELGGYRTRWSAIQTGFVDEPRRAVEEADSLVAELMKRLAESFSEERRQLEGRWEHADQVSTEELRLAMRRYRSFFERLLSI
ncbi:MAG TPA: hypothetical protein VJ813_05905 [Vicinamibacterales bacterium]|nr:hypothetical protein [Vicinamibacterales bacterium]